MSDLRYALRQLAKYPGFTAVAVLTLALGIGATTALFSVVRSVLLQPLPFPEDERLAVVLLRAPRFNMVDFRSSPPEYVAYRDQTRSWEQLAAYQERAATVTGGSAEPERVQVAFVTWNLFAALRTEPLRGRRFTPDEGQEGSEATAILSHAFWTSRYGGDPRVIGQTVLLDDVVRTIVGVMPAEFRFPNPDVRFWLPLAFSLEDLQNRGAHGYSVVGRLRPNVTLVSAEAELAALIARLAADTSSVGPLPRMHGWHTGHLRPLRAEIVGDVSRTLWVMLGAVGLVLLIACANVANLLLVRAEARMREMSLRTALGAGRRRLMLQLLTESLVLAGTGGLAGVLLAYLGVDALRAIAPADLPRLDEIAVDGTVLAFTMILTGVAGILSGLAPALHVGRADLQGSLREGARGGTATRSRIRLRHLLVVSETALAVVLLVAAGLLLQSFRQVLAVDPGFRTEHVLTASLTVPPDRYVDSRDQVGFYEALLSRIRSLPGVAAAGAAVRAPLAGGLNATDIEVEGWVNAGDAPRATGDVQVVTPGYLAAIQTPLLEGRDIEERDRMSAPLVALVSEGLARTYWPGRSALGGRIRLDWDDQPFAEVVGVVREVRYGGLERPPDRGTLYLAHAQTPLTTGSISSMMLTLRSGVEPTSLVNMIRREVYALDPSVPVYQVRTMDQAVADTTGTRRFSMLLQLLFALVALSLAAVGLYGVLAFTVARRTAEIGIRLALGATRSDVLRMVLSQGLGIVAAAVVLGVCGAFATGRLLRSLLFGVSPGDPMTYATVVSVLLGVALFACWLPARRATRIDPMEALRHE